MEVALRSSRAAQSRLWRWRACGQNKTFEKSQRGWRAVTEGEVGGDEVRERQEPHLSGTRSSDLTPSVKGSIQRLSTGKDISTDLQLFRALWPHSWRKTALVPLNLVCVSQYAKEQKKPNQINKEKYNCNYLKWFWPKNWGKKVTEKDSCNPVPSKNLGTLKKLIKTHGKNYMVKINFMKLTEMNLNVNINVFCPKYNSFSHSFLLTLIVYSTFMWTILEGPEMLYKLFASFSEDQSSKLLESPYSMLCTISLT